jgi:hypothetical protein
MKKAMSRLIFCGWLVIIALLLPLDAWAQREPQPFWNVDIGVAGTFTPVGGSDPVGIGPAISVAITKDTFRGEKDSNGGGFVATYMTTWAVNQTGAGRGREDWMLAGARGNVWEDVGLLAFQAVGGVKRVSSQTYGAFGLGLSFNMPPVGQRVLIRAFDLNWFLTPGDPVSSHRFSIGFGVDVLAGHSIYGD